MGRTHDVIDDRLKRRLEAQPVFFVGTAPLDGDGHVNLSPKGYDSFRVLGPTTVAYLDLTGSGSETIAHVRENGRITLMFCNFSGKPDITRLFGRGRILLDGDDGFDELAARFPDLPGRRSIVQVEVDRIQSSCGYSVPLMDHVGDRDDLLRWAQRKGDDGLRDYWAEKNTTSIDGLPALRVHDDQVV
jgi:hypothetical protein